MNMFESGWKGLYGGIESSLEGAFDTGGSGSDTLATGSMDTMTPEQMALLKAQITSFDPTGGTKYSPTGPASVTAPVIHDPNLIDPKMINFNSGAFSKSVVNPMMEEINRQLTSKGEQFAGNRFGGERQKANERIIQTGQDAIAKALAEKTFQIEQSNQSAGIEAGKANLGAETTIGTSNAGNALQAFLANQNVGMMMNELGLKAEELALMDAGQQNALLQMLLGAKSKENYAVALGGETRGAGLGTSILTGASGGIGRGFGSALGGLL